MSLQEDEQRTLSSFSNILTLRDVILLSIGAYFSYLYIKSSLAYKV